MNYWAVNVPRTWDELCWGNGDKGMKWNVEEMGRFVLDFLGCVSEVFHVSSQSEDFCSIGDRKLAPKISLSK